MTDTNQQQASATGTPRVDTHIAARHEFKTSVRYLISIHDLARQLERELAALKAPVEGEPEMPELHDPPGANRWYYAYKDVEVYRDAWRALLAAKNAELAEVIAASNEWARKWQEMRRQYANLRYPGMTGEIHANSTELAAAKATPSGWQPIETAPESDETLLLLVPTKWHKWNATLPLSGCRMGTFWVIFNADEAVQRVEPTHWQPLPEAPQ